MTQTPASQSHSQFQHFEESAREVEQIRHVNETISQDDTYRAQTEASDIQIVTPHYKSGERPGSEVRTGASAAELNARFAKTHGDHKAERSQEHFRMQIIDPKVDDHAHLPAHAPRDYVRRKLIEDFPSLHSKRSFLDLDALEQRSVRKPKPISISKYLTDSVDRHPKDDDFRDLDKLKRSLDALQKVRMNKDCIDLSKIPLAPRLVKPAAELSERHHDNLSTAAVGANTISISREQNESGRRQNFQDNVKTETEKSQSISSFLDSMSGLEGLQIGTTNSVKDIAYSAETDGRVVYWPPFDATKSAPVSVPQPRSIFDATARAEFERQKARELTAMKERDVEATKWLEKQEAAHRRQAEKLAADGICVNEPSTLPPSTAQQSRSWRHVYVVDGETLAAARNEILTGGELLRRDLPDGGVDILQKREAFIERRPSPPRINYVGRRWQPPTVTNKVIDYEASDEYRWLPLVYEPPFQKERKNFTPPLSPTAATVSSCYGLGNGALDDAASRQLRDVILPLADGGHRPPILFPITRQAPAGGFYPQAPNVIKVVVKRHNRRSQINSTEKSLPEESFPTQNSNTVFPQCNWKTADPFQLPRYSSTHGYGNDRSRFDIWRRAALQPPPIPPHRRIQTHRLASQPANGTPPSYHLVRQFVPPTLPSAYHSIEAAAQPKEPPPAPPVVRTVVPHEPVRHEVVEVRREVKPKVTQNVQRFEERKRTEEVERRVIRRERRHKSSRVRYGHHHGGNQNQHYQREWHDWGTGGRGIRSSSAASRNGYGGGGGADYYYHSSSRHGGGRDSDRYYHRGADQRYIGGGSISDSLLRGDLKYGPNGDVRENGHHNGNASEKYSSTRRVHKSYSTRDIYGGGGASSHGYGSHQPVVEFPPTLPRHGGSSQYGAPAPPPHRQNGHGHHTEYYYHGGSGGVGTDSGGRLTKSRSYADWGDGGRGLFGSSIRRYDDDMARLENEFRDSLLMKLPTNGGNMNEKDYRHEQIPGGYETYEREVKASSGRKYHPDGAPTDFKEFSQGYNFKRETQR